MKSPKGNWIDDYGPHPREWYATTVVEQDKPQEVVIYDHEGKPYHRPRQPMGFDLRKQK